MSQRIITVGTATATAPGPDTELRVADPEMFAIVEVGGGRHLVDTPAAAFVPDVLQLARTEGAQIWNFRMRTRGEAARRFVAADGTPEAAEFEVFEEAVRAELRAAALEG
jgi:hypothetical protein